MWPTLTLGPSSIFENQDDRVAGGDALVLRRDLGELTAVLAEKFFEDDFGFLDLRGVELLSTVSPTLRSLKRSRMSDSETECMPS